MTQTFEAIYENGLLRPLAPLEIAEHAKVRVSIVDETETPTTHPLLKYCGTVSDEDTAEIQKIIEVEFEKVDPDEWK
jgi:predicted DNA-binding antitoxin AbrB/MazE fold protein